MDYICDEIIFVIKYENYIYTSKLLLWVNFFVMDGMDIHQLSLKPFKILEFLAENPSKNVCFYISLPTNA
jgi:hypothetical protein